MLLLPCWSRRILRHPALIKITSLQQRGPAVLLPTLPPSQRVISLRSMSGLKFLNSGQHIGHHVLQPGISASPFCWLSTVSFRLLNWTQTGPSLSILSMVSKCFPDPPGVCPPSYFILFSDLFVHALSYLYIRSSWTNTVLSWPFSVQQYTTEAPCMSLHSVVFHRHWQTPLTAGNFYQYIDTNYSLWVCM